MKVAVIGSRNITVEDLSQYIPKETLEIVSGGAKGIDSQAKAFASKNNIKFTEFNPDYHRFGRGAPLKRNLEIIAYADYVVAIWDGKSKGTKFVIDHCDSRKIKVHIL